MTSDDELRPILRIVEPIHRMVDGFHVVGLKDPLRLSGKIPYVRAEAIPILQMLDGRHSLRDIQYVLTKEAGTVIHLEEIKAFVNDLEESFLLEGDRFRHAYQELVHAYREQPYRPARHAGTAYEADPVALRAQLDGFFTGEDGPGLPEFRSDPRRPVGLIAPHIDIRAGGTCFARGYHALVSGQPSDLYVIFGTGHSGVEGACTAGTRDYMTPLGKVTTDRVFLENLEAELGRDPAAEELLHIDEHVIEFQTVFLQHMLGGRHTFTVVPVLVSVPHQCFGEDKRFAHLRGAFTEFCAALKAVCARESRSICFISSADLDHIGPRYGDEFVPHRGMIEDTLERDGKLLRHLERVDLEAFIRDVAEENDARRICGFSPITAMLHCMQASEGHLLDLNYATVDNRSSFVSFTSMIFY